MQVQNINPTTNFQARKVPLRLSDTMKRDFQNLLYKMNHDTSCEISENGNALSSRAMGAIRIDKKATFMDKRILTAPIENGQADCSMEFGKNHIEINSQTGEVFSKRKSFWKTWSEIIQDSYLYVLKALDNYNNPDIVEKRCLGIV